MENLDSFPNISYSRMIIFFENGNNKEIEYFYINKVNKGIMLKLMQNTK